MIDLIIGLPSPLFEIPTILFNKKKYDGVLWLNVSRNTSNLNCRICFGISRAVPVINIVEVPIIVG